MFQTWYRPRDIIRLLLIAREFHPHQKVFSQEVFDSTKEDYSKMSWYELCEELKTSHSEDELESIERLLRNFNREFSYEEISECIKDLSKTDKHLNNIINKNGLNKFLDELYRVGILGNIIEYPERIKYKFIYTGQDALLYNQRIIVHRALWPFLYID
jgi:hypothetical protein